MKILVTGGAGFIGSHISEALLGDSRVSAVVILDNLSTGFRSNIQHILDHPKLTYIEDTTCAIEACRKAVNGCDAVCHQAALGSVPRSIIDPLASNDANVNGFLNILQAAREANVRKIVYASSSSVYGDSPELPKVESKVGEALSPYAVTKKTNELYAGVFAQFGINITGFRYFNVFGPRQSPNGPYAAVIPLFIQAALSDQAPKINGDGTNSRDFTYIDNVVKANLSAIFRPIQPNRQAEHNVYNIACGQATTLNQLWEIIRNLVGSEVTPEYRPARQGDISHSLADISKAAADIGYGQLVNVADGLKLAVDWYRANLSGL